ncbi:putative Zn-dependent peptidase [Haloferula luteola]|uniref:Putative Zn-dependent peptidase n=1 Tax=Haloferula luteola TaxID=595692 RepID=A0A840VCN1_9BACT|nr:pitrilysin family protein [Haloferula luteola]MBB5350611.1 putative Zn-dependent peptidase [Haloferula luteola]
MRATYHETRSQSGVRLAIAELPDSECAALSIHLPAGSRDDPAGLAGTAHFVEHMLFKGTERRDARTISIETEDVGAMLNAHTSEDQTSYEGRGDADTLPLLADILCDMVWHSRFAPPDIALEREVIAEEIVMYEESPGDHIGDLLSSALWSPHPLGEPISGTLESLRRIDRKALQKFAALHHRRRDMVVAVAGPFSPQTVVDLLDPLLPELTDALPSSRFSGLPPGESVRIDERETQQLQLAIAYPTFGRLDPRRHALRLLAMILGEGSSSRLFLKLREDRGLCYHVSCDASLLEETGALEFNAGLDPESRDEAIAVFEAELAELAENGPHEAELARAKRLSFSQHRASMENTSSHAAWAADSLLQHGRILHPQEALLSVEAVTVAAVREVARDVLASGSRARAEIRPS